VLCHSELAEWIESVQAGSFHMLWRHLGCDRPTQGLQLLLSPAQYTCLAPLLLTWAWYWQVFQVRAIRVFQCQGSRGRAASGGALATEPPRATSSQPESIRIVVPQPFFQIYLTSACPALDEVKKKVDISRLKSKCKNFKKIGQKLVGKKI